MDTIPYDKHAIPCETLKEFFLDGIIEYVPEHGILGYASSWMIKSAMGKYYKRIRRKEKWSSDILVLNAYYDIIISSIKRSPFRGTLFERLLPGCTAFAMDTDQGPIHARNLDWPGPYQLTDDCVEVDHPEFTTVGWDGLEATFTGMRPGAFSISLNAVVSEEGVGIGGLSAPIAVRTALERCDDYDSAVHFLSSIRLVSDCILMVVGTEPGEMCVIERTPQHSLIREPENGILVATNHYVEMPGELDLESEISESSLSRYNRVCNIRRKKDPFKILKDRDVMMDITVHHTVMRPADGYMESRRAV
jgi:hypothetical protein